MKALLIATSLFLMPGAALADDRANAEQELLKIRQKMETDLVTEATVGDLAKALSGHYTADVILKSLCPEQPPIIGRDAYLKGLQSLIQRGFRNYKSRATSARLVDEDQAWTTGAYTFTIDDKDGNPVYVQGNWLDMLRREQGVWKVSFYAMARAPCQ